MKYNDIIIRTSDLLKNIIKEESVKISENEILIIDLENDKSPIRLRGGDILNITSSNKMGEALLNGIISKINESRKLKRKTFLLVEQDKIFVFWEFFIGDEYESNILQ